MKFLEESIPTSTKTHMISKQRRNSKSMSNESKKSSLSTVSNSALHYSFRAGECIGEYRVVKLLGDGTFGRVVQAQRKGKLYAIKVLSLGIQVIRPVQKYIESAKIQREILKTVNARDPKDCEGIVRYKHSLQHNGYFCLVFQPLGKSLYDILKLNQFRPFPLKVVQQYLKQLLSTLSYLHRIGYTHTDLKPQNILLESELVQTAEKEYAGKNTKIRVIDFGGATKHNDFHSRVICTRQYRPPEVILECEWNELADVWSVGCIGAELASGQVLFPARSDTEHLLMIEKGCGSLPKWMIHKTPSTLGKLFLDGRISEKEADHALDHWERVNNFVPHTSLPCAPLADLLSLCLQPDPNKRIACRKALLHPFFKL